jgi:hypothetical protein
MEAEVKMYPMLANPMGQRPMNKMAMTKADGDGTLRTDADFRMGMPDPPIDGSHPGDFGPGIDGSMGRGRGNDDFGPPDGGGVGDVRTPPPGAGGGGFQIPGFISDQLNNFSGILSNPMLGPSLATAMQQFRQSRQYTDMAEHYADRLDPFGRERNHYQDLMRDSYDNPTKVLQDPAYQKQLQFELGNLQIQGAGKGWDGSGNMMAALSDRQHNMDEQHIMDYRKGLSPLTGAQFGPESSGHMLETGLAGRMGAENNAVRNLMAPFGNQSANNRSPNGKAPTDAAGVLNALKPGGAISSAAGPASQWIQQQLAHGVTVDPNDPHVTQAIEEMSQGNYDDMGMGGDQFGSGYDTWQGINNDDLMSQFGSGGDWSDFNFDDLPSDFFDFGAFG